MSVNLGQNRARNKYCNSTVFPANKTIECFGGDINQAYRLDGVFAEKEESFFIKLNQKHLLDMFEAEAAGLEEIEQAQTIHVPHVICSGVADSQSFLILENLNMGGGVNTTNAAARLGQQLAAMHKNTSQQFGWSRDNTIGLTKQVNTRTDSWIEFWQKHRLGFQLNLAKKKGCGKSLVTKGEKLITELKQFFVTYEPEASLLHGDLWSGNYSYLKNGEPVIFDPAVYYGDREADIAMTELFGGFSSEFYAAYNEAWPLDKGYQQRKKLYNLYHVLNHYNLFGGGYAMQAENMIDQLLSNL